jgi:hypothetical protein
VSLSFRAHVATLVAVVVTTVAGVVTTVAGEMLLLQQLVSGALAGASFASPGGGYRA